MSQLSGVPSAGIDPPGDTPETIQVLDEINAIGAPVE
jgi:hypothetical protein